MYIITDLAFLSFLCIGIRVGAEVLQEASHSLGCDGKPGQGPFAYISVMNLYCCRVFLMLAGSVTTFYGAVSQRPTLRVHQARLIDPRQARVKNSRPGQLEVEVGDEKKVSTRALRSLPWVILPTVTIAVFPHLLPSPHRTPGDPSHGHLMNTRQTYIFLKNQMKVRLKRISYHNVGNLKAH